VVDNLINGSICLKEVQRQPIYSGKLAKSFFEVLNPEDRKVFYLDNPLQAKRSSG
jgi:hypothetical protein